MIIDHIKFILRTTQNKKDTPKIIVPRLNSLERNFEICKQ